MAYDQAGNALFMRNCRDKDEARKEVMFNPWAFKVVEVRFKGKKYPIADVRAWELYGDQTGKAVNDERQYKS
jgi:hypothetical protein